MERGHREMYRVRIGERGKYGEEGIHGEKREDILCTGRVAGERNEWRLQTTRERRMARNPWRKRGRETRAKRENSREEANEESLLLPPPPLSPLG